MTKMSKYNTAKIIKNSIYLVFILFIISYGLYNSRIFIQGPQIDVFDPVSGETIEESPLIRIKGEARNVAFIELNNRQIDVNEDSKFDEPVLLYPGYNIITIFARDKFDRSVERKVELVYKGDDLYDDTSEDLKDAEETLENATSSLETSTSSPTTSLEEF